MSLDFIERTIKNKRANSSLYLDDVLGMMKDVIFDAKDTNHVDDAGMISLRDGEEFAELYCSIIGFLNMAYRNNIDKIKEKGSDLLEDCEERAAQIEECASVMNELNTKIKEALKQQEDLNRQNAELEKTRGHLRDVKDKNEQLLANIEKLSDPNLERINEENKKLEQNINEQSEKHDELIKKQEEIKTKLAEIQTVVDSAENELEQLNAEFSRQNEILERNTEEKKSLESGINNIKNKITELENWINNVSTERGKVNTKRQELQSKVNALLTAWNIFNNDKVCERIDDYKKISEWFEKSFSDVEKKIDEVMQKYSALLAEAKKLTEEKGE